MGGSVISTLSFVLVVLWWVNCFLVGNHLSTCPHENSCRYADGWQSLQVMNMVMSSMNITSDQWSPKGFVNIILVMNLTGYVRDHYLGNTIYDKTFVIIILIMVFQVIW